MNSPKVTQHSVLNTPLCLFLQYRGSISLKYQDEIKEILASPDHDEIVEWPRNVYFATIESSPKNSEIDISLDSDDRMLLFPYGTPC